MSRVPRIESARDEVGPYAALAARARRTSDGALTAAAALGVLAVLALVLWGPAWWVAEAPLVAVGAFGIWGTLERERAGRSHADGRPHALPVRRALAIGQWAAVVVGTAAVVLAALRVLGALIGTVIS